MGEGDNIRFALALAVKDITVELRRAHELLSIIAFAMTSIIVSSFAWRGSLIRSPEVLSAALWIVIYFSTILALTTSFAREVDRGTIEGLKSLPTPPFVVLAGKVMYGLVVLLLVLLTTVMSSIIFLNLNVALIPALLVLFVVGVMDLALVGSVVSALVMYSEGKTLLLSFLFFPVSVPVLIPSTQAAGKILSGYTLIEVMPEVQLLLAFLLTIGVASFLLFGHVFQE
jgi:heme exporter protein CcmB